MTPPLPIRTKLLYGSGSIAYGVKDHAFRVLLLIYYNQVIGLPAQLVATAIMVALVVDSFLDPIIGQVSDNWRSRWGRRHPFMYASALPVGVSFVLLWTPPAGWSDAALFGYILVVAVVVRSFIALYEIPSSALAPELSDDYDERTSVLSYRYFFGYWGGLGMAFAALAFFLQPTAEYPVGQLNPAGYWHYGLVAGALMTISIIVSTVGTHDRIPTLRQPPKPAPRPVMATVREMLSTLSHRPFLLIVAYGLFKTTAVGLVSALVLYFGTYFWELSSGKMAILVLDGFVSAALALVIAPKLSRRFEKKSAAIGLAVAAILVGVAPLALRLVGLFPENGSPLLLPILFVVQTVNGTFNIISLILVASMVSDVVDDSALATGRRSEGLFFSATSLLQKAISGLGIFVSGMVLAAVGFPEGAKPGAVDAGVLENLALAYLGALAVLYVVAVAFLSRYPITRAVHQANLARLAAAEPALTAGIDDVEGPVQLGAQPSPVR